MVVLVEVVPLRVHLLAVQELLDKVLAVVQDSRVQVVEVVVQLPQEALQPLTAHQEMVVSVS
jgi:hypothetical protein